MAAYNRTLKMTKRQIIGGSSTFLAHWLGVNFDLKPTLRFIYIKSYGDVNPLFQMGASG